MARLSDLQKAGTLLSNEFIVILEEHFPDKMPEPNASDKEIQQDIGKVQVIRTIKRWKEMLDHPDEHPEDESIFEKGFN
jgi:hypothetical protein